VGEAKQGLGDYFQFYNRERLHQSLGYQTPEAVYRQDQNSAAEATLI
jgi:putative transposase